uniref:Uncharacterized protein n=1 Tax=Rhizophora mucronata TaxID=61149 RepID=A0A2P2NYT2_RHIMU
MVETTLETSHTKAQGRFTTPVTYDVSSLPSSKQKYVSIGSKRVLNHITITNRKQMY